MSLEPWFDRVWSREETEIAEPTPDQCKCSTCGSTFKIVDCPQDYGHHDGLEMPAYTEIICSKCEDGGCIDDFFFSGENNESL